MPKNNVLFRLVRYDEVIVIAPDRHSPTSSISKRLANFVGDYRHHASSAAALIVRLIEVHVKGALSYPPEQFVNVNARSHHGAWRSVA
jgi:hypothetical protein